MADTLLKAMKYVIELKVILSLKELVCWADLTYFFIVTYFSFVNVQTKDQSASEQERVNNNLQIRFF